MKLIIAEKPSLGRSIAEAIPGSASGKDPIYKGDFCITWLYGHILSLKEPQDYDEQYAKWDISQLPIFFDDWALKPSDGKEDRLEQIGRLLNDAELVIHAGDPDDEGQLLVDEVLRWFDYKGPVKRLDTANTTETALLRALNKMTDNAPREIDGWSAYARSVADMLVGVNMSRFFTCSNNGKTLTVGRVQTPTLGLVVKRDLLIESHEKVLYYTISAEVDINGVILNCSFQLPKEDTRLTDGRLLSKAHAEQIAKEIEGKQLLKISIEKKIEKEKPPLPFNLVKLQTYCGNHFGYDPQQVMDITQNLKDSGAITYNRSDCQYLSMDHFKEAPRTVSSVCGNLGTTPERLDTTIKSGAFNDNNITAHFAIIPTDSKRDISAMSVEERNVYTAIAQYYLVQFMPDCVKEKTTLSAELAEYGTITATSTRVTDEGYHIILPLKNDTESALSQFAAGTYNGLIQSAIVREKETKPPARYTKTSLNEDMTRIAKYVEDETVRKLLLEKDKDKKGENGSIGTSATRATIIDTLVMRGFLMEENKRLISTELGREFYRILPDELKKPDMTAYWWVIQEQIKSGEADYSKLPISVHETICHILTQKYPLLVSAAKIPKDRKVVGRCPTCNGYVVEGNNAYGCMNYKSGCKFTIWKKQNGSLLKNVTITPQMAESLLLGDTIESKKLYSEKTKSTFFGGLKLEKSEIGSGFSLSFVPIERPAIGICPRCGGNVIEGKNAYGCANYKTGCRFTIWKLQKSSLFKNITITPTMAGKLLKGETITSKRLYSKNKDVDFFGGFRLVDRVEDFGAVLELVSDIERPVVGLCPYCDSPVVEDNYGFRCTNREQQCRFIIWKNQKSSLFKNIVISESMAKKLLQKEVVTSKQLFSTKTNQTFFGGFRLSEKLVEYGAELVLVLDIEKPVIGTCPRCKGNVYEGKNAFSCENYVNGCRFTIWKASKNGYLKHIRINETMAKKLLKGEAVSSNKLCLPRSEEQFPGEFRLSDRGEDYGADYQIEWQQGKYIGKCPRCGKTVREIPFAYRCSGYNDGCRYSFLKKNPLRLFSQLEVDVDMAKALHSGEIVYTDKLYSEKIESCFSGAIVLQDYGSEYGPSLQIVEKEKPDT